MPPCYEPLKVLLECDGRPCLFLPTEELESRPRVLHKVGDCPWRNRRPVSNNDLAQALLTDSTIVSWRHSLGNTDHDECPVALAIQRRSKSSKVMEVAFSFSKKWSGAVAIYRNSRVEEDLEHDRPSK